MSEPRTGSRCELLIAREGSAQSKAAGDCFAIHPGDVEEIEELDDLVGHVHSYEVGSTVDGPGLRLVAFLTACLLRCQYCHNPETWHKHNGHPVTVSRAMRQIGKYTQILKTARGGVALSGGEPKVQVADSGLQMLHRFRRLRQRRSSPARTSSRRPIGRTSARR